MNTDRPIVLLVWLCALAGAHGQGTFTITFDGPPPQPRGTAYHVQSYPESGMWFAPIPGTDGFVRNGGGIAFFPDNSTPYLQGTAGDSLMFGFEGALLFDLLSVDLAEYSTIVPQAVTVPFVGYRPDGTAVTQTFTTDGIIDGTGPLTDFQTFYFGPGFAGVYRVGIPSDDWSLDNLVVSVPEPRVGAFLALAGGLLAARILTRTVPATRGGWVIELAH